MSSNLDSTASPPLDGLKVLEICATGSYAASLLAMILADQGADVVKMGLDADNLPVAPEHASSKSREVRARAGVDRNKNVLQVQASLADVQRLIDLTDVVIIPYDTGIPQLAPESLRKNYPALVVITLC